MIWVSRALLILVEPLEYPRHRTFADRRGPEQENVTMTSIARDNLDLALDLDRAAMHRVNGCYTYAGSTIRGGA